MANTNSPLKMANTNTPLKTIFRCEGSQSLRTEPHCFICLRSPSGKLRNIVTNVALPDNNPILKDIRKCLNMDSNAQFSIHECKICLTCKRHLENCVEFQNKLNEAIDRKPTSTCSTKRMAFSQTPSSSKKGNVSDVSNKENIPARKVNCKKKKKLFLELDTDVQSDVKKSDMCQSDHNYGSFASPVDMAHINSVRAKQELFCKKNHQDQCYSADDIFKNKILLSEVQKLILLETEVVADKLFSLSIQPGPSVLRTLQHPSSLKSEDILHKCLLEFQNCFPFVFRVFQTLASPLHADQQRTNTCNSTIAMMYAMAMNRRNKDLCAMQKINTCIALRFHAGNDLLDIFNKTSITLSADSKYTFLDKMGDLNTEGIVRSVQMGIGGKVTVDNIDGMTIARDVRLTGGNKHYHYTASTYYPDRADLTDLEESTTLTPPEEINFDVFYLSAEEESRLKEMYGYMVGRTLVKYFPAMKWMEPCIPSHIPHQYSQQMESKSQIFPLKIILQDPKYYGGCIEVLNELSRQLMNSYEKAGRRDEFETVKITLGGDQLVRVRMSGAKDLLAGAHTAAERMEIFDPVVEELFHVEQDYLEKLFKRFFSPKTSRQEGSLAFFKCQLRRTNVNGQVKGGFQAHSDFLHTVGEALLIQLCMKKFSMDSLESEPVIPNLDLPENIRNTHVKTRKPLFWKVVQEVVNEIFMEFHNPGCLPPVHLDFEDTSVIIPREQLCKNGYVDLKMSTGEVYRVFNSHETTDDLQNYSIQLLMWYIHFCEFQDGIREGDPFRTNINLKRMIPFFYSHSVRSKYAVECIDYILKTEVMLPKLTAMRVRLGSFVNPHGKKGGNKPADMQQENNILVLKDVIKGLGANKTTKAMERASAAAPVVAETVENYMSNIRCISRSGKHSTKDNLEDVTFLVQILGGIDPFSVIDNRKMNFYNSFRKNPFSSISSEFHSHLFKIVERLKRCQNIDLEYYNQ